MKFFSIAAVIAAFFLAVVSVQAESNQITNPAAFEVLFAGTEYTIKWKQTTSGTVDLTLKEGSSDIIIAKGIDNTGSHVWRLPSSLADADDYMIELQTSDGGSSYAGPFTIRPGSYLTPQSSSSPDATSESVSTPTTSDIATTSSPAPLESTTPPSSSSPTESSAWTSSADSLVPTTFETSTLPSNSPSSQPLTSPSTTETSTSPGTSTVGSASTTSSPSATGTTNKTPMYIGIGVGVGVPLLFLLLGAAFWYGVKRERRSASELGPDPIMKQPEWPARSAFGGSIGLSSAPPSSAADSPLQGSTGISSVSPSSPVDPYEVGELEGSGGWIVWEQQRSRTAQELDGGDKKELHKTVVV